MKLAFLSLLIGSFGAKPTVVAKGPLAGWFKDGRGGFLYRPPNKSGHRNWHDALNYCHELGASLVTIPDAEYNDMVANLVTDGTRGTWINAYKLPMGTYVSGHGK